MKKGDKFIHTDILGKKYELTYTGTRREVKGCEFEFFTDDKGKVCFFTDTEVEKMEKIDMNKKLELMVELMYVMGQFGKNLTAEKTAEIIERDGSVVTGFVVTDKYGNVGIIDKGAVKWIDKAKFYGMMHNEIEFNGDDLVKSVESFVKTI